MRDEAREEIPVWKEQVRENWRDIDLEKFCGHAGIEFHKNFEISLNSSDATTNPYDHYRWEILDGGRIQHGVLHLVPHSVTELPALWEEWFLDEGLIHHHVLRNHPHHLATDTWLGDVDDTEHPRQVLGAMWHYSNDSDLRPVGFR